MLLNNGGIPFVYEGFVFDINTGDNAIFTIHTGDLFTYNYDIYLNNALLISGLTGDYVITGLYTTTKYLIEIRGTFPFMSMINASVAEQNMFGNIHQWGNIEWQSFYQMFYNCKNMDIIATDSPILSTSFNGVFNSIFYGCSSLKDLNGTLANWDWNKFTNSSNAFNGCSLFNTDLSQVDTSNITQMDSFFSRCYSFIQDISGWCVTNISAEPISFDSYTSADWTTAMKPVWGTCP